MHTHAPSQRNIHTYICMSVTSFYSCKRLQYAWVCFLSEYMLHLLLCWKGVDGVRCTFAVFVPSTASTNKSTSGATLQHIISSWQPGQAARTNRRHIVVQGHYYTTTLLHSTLNSTQLSSTPASTGWMYADRHSRRKYRHRDEPLSRSTMHRQLPQFALRMRERWGSMWSCLQAVFSGEFTHVVSNYICTYVLSYLHTIFCNKIASTTD